MINVAEESDWEWDCRLGVGLQCWWRNYEETGTVREFAGGPYLIYTILLVREAHQYPGLGAGHRRGLYWDGTKRRTGDRPTMGTMSIPEDAGEYRGGKPKSG